MPASEEAYGEGHPATLPRQETVKKLVDHIGQMSGEAHGEEDTDVRRIVVLNKPPVHTYDPDDNIER